MVDDPLGNLTHGLTQVHGSLLDPTEGFWLSEAQAGLEHPLGLVDELAGLKTLLKVGDLVFNSTDLLESSKSDLDRGHDV